MSDTITMAPAAGWYPDPMDDAAWRWWDGARWSEQIRPKHAEAAPAAPVVPAFEPAAYAPPVFVPEPEPVHQAPQPVLQPAPTPVFVPSQYAPPALSPEPVYVSEPAAAEVPPVIDVADLHPVAPSAPAAVVPYTPLLTPPAAPIDTVVAVAPSSEVALYDAAVLEPTYPWEAAIAALEAEQRAKPLVAPAAGRAREPRARAPRSERPSSALVVVAPSYAEATESPSTPWIWLLAFSPILVAAIAGALAFFAAPMLIAAGIDAPIAGLAVGAVSLLPVWMIAGLDVGALRRRGFTPPSVLWILLLTPLAYFLVRSRALSRDGAGSRGPIVAYLVNLLLVGAAAAAAIVLFLPLITAAGLNPFAPKVVFDPPSTSKALYDYGIGVQTPQANVAGKLAGGDTALWKQAGTALSKAWLDTNGGYVDCSASEQMVALNSTFPCFAERFDAQSQPTGAVTLNVTIDPTGAISYTEVAAAK